MKKVGKIRKWLQDCFGYNIVGRHQKKEKNENSFDNNGNIDFADKLFK